MVTGRARRCAHVEFCLALVTGTRLGDSGLSCDDRRRHVLWFPLDLLAFPLGRISNTSDASDM